MKPIDQKYLRGDPAGIPGDCVRACVCSILDLPLTEMPHFVRWHGECWADAMFDWCLERGIAAKPRNGDIKALDYYMLTGPSWISGAPTRHAVVYFAGQMRHDPHPARAGIVGSGRLISWQFSPL